MNWEATGAVAEALGAIGVIVSVIYLALQIRQNTASSKAASYLAIVESSNAFEEMFSRPEDQYILKVLGNWAAFSSLREEQKFRATRVIMNFVRNASAQIQLADDGLIPEEVTEVWTSYFARVANDEAFITWWTENSWMIHAAFRRRLAARLGRQFDPKPAASGT